MAASLRPDDMKQQQLNIPIPVFPPFKLRSSLIDKDPVIWEYLLADYITLFRKLLALSAFQAKPRGGKVSKNMKLSPYIMSSKTLSQLHTFLQSFLHESSLESNQVFSLGAINPNIRQNQHLLKLIVFQYIKSLNLINLKITGDLLWDFCKVYITMADKYANERINQALITLPVIRKLVEGSVKSSLNSKSNDISLIRSLQDSLSKLIASGKWRNEDSEILFLLLGQKTKKNFKNDKNNKNKNFKKNYKVSDNGNGSGDFAEKFVNKHWIQNLEELYSGGNGIHADLCVKIMVISISALSSAKILKLLKSDFEIDSLIRFKQFTPLLSNVTLSRKFNELNPDLKDMLSSILLKHKQRQNTIENGNESTGKSFNNEDIQNVIDMFPQLSPGKVKTLLAKFENVENVINHMLEINISEIETIEDYDEMINLRREKLELMNSKKNKNRNTNKNIFDIKLDGDAVYTVQIGKKEVTDLEDVDTEYKNKTLQRALTMLYDADEDEPDDTYLDNEPVTGSKFKNDEDNENIKLDKKLLEIESKLFGIYSTDRSKLERINRNTPYRRELRLETGWTDEQLEGWARVLDKSPKRFRQLEDRLVYVDGSLNRTGKKSTKWSSKRANDEDTNVDKTGRNKKDTTNNKSDDKKDSTSKQTIVGSKNSGNFKMYMKKKQQNKK